MWQFKIAGVAAWKSTILAAQPGSGTDSSKLLLILLGVVLSILLVAVDSWRKEIAYQNRKRSSYSTDQDKK